MLMQTEGPSQDRPGTTARGRAAMALRCVTALIGGYAAAAALATLAARLLPGDPAEATAFGMMLSILLYAVIGLWCFYEPRLGRVVAAIWGIAAVAVTIVWWLGVRA